MPKGVIGRRVQSLQRGRFWRSVIVIVTGTVIGQVISVATLPVISRLYPPVAFGQYALLASLSALLTIVVTIGLSSAIMAPKEDVDAEQVAVVALACSIVFATVLTGTALALGSVLPMPPTGMPLWQLCVWVYTMTIVNALTALLRVHTNRLGLNRALAVNSVLSALCTLAIAVPLGFLDLGSLGLILSGLTAGLVSSLQMMWRANPFAHRITWSMVTSTLRTHRGYVSYQYAANLMETAGVQMPTQLLAAVYGSTKLGSYSMNERLLGIPLRLVGTPVSTVYFRSISQSFRAGHDLAPLTFSIVSKVMLAGSAPMAILIFWAPSLFSWALGAEWRDAGELCVYLVPLYVLTLCRASVSNCRVVIGRQRTNAGLSAVRLGIVLGSLAVGHVWLGTIVGAVFALSVGSSLFMLLDMAVNFALLKSHVKRYLLLMLSFGGGVVALWYGSGAFAELLG